VRRNSPWAPNYDQHVGGFSKRLKSLGKKGGFLEQERRDGPQAQCNALKLSIGIPSEEGGTFCRLPNVALEGGVNGQRGGEGCIVKRVLATIVWRKCHHEDGQSDKFRKKGRQHGGNATVRSGNSFVIFKETVCAEPPEPKGRAINRWRGQEACESRRGRLRA